MRRQPRGWRHKQDGKARTVGRAEGAYRSSSKKDKSRFLDEFTAITGHHPKHGIRLLSQLHENDEVAHQARGQRIHDEAAKEAVIMIWEAADRICGRRLNAAMPCLAQKVSGITDSMGKAPMIGILEIWPETPAD